MHGYDIANPIRRISENVLQVGGTIVYPALQRMLIKVVQAIMRVIQMA